MWQTIISFCIIVITLFFIGKRAYRQIRKAIDPASEISCDCGCSGCSSNGDSRK